tara:strand:+ start:1318 stop:1470 length:153 start_codon:yes stop_codon:yes gene_type:complete
MSRYKVTIEVDQYDEVEIKETYAKNKDDIIIILKNHIAMTTGDYVRVDKI